MAIASTNPATSEMMRTFDAHTAAEIEAKLQGARETFQIWRLTPFAERAAKMTRLAELLEERKEEYGRLAVLEMGKPIRAAVEEVAKCATVCRYYAENAEAQLADEEVASSADRSFIRYQPLGPVLAVMPWNFPFWQVFRFAAPALMAGNVGLLKHSANVPQCALAIEQVMLDAGFAQGCFQTLLVGTDAVGALLDDSRIMAATLTGSEAAGSKVASQAGARIKKTILELGGSDPFIVMPSADLDEAMKTAVKARTINNGQSCIAAKRFIVHEAIAAEFEKRFVVGMEALRVGDPMDEATDIGPLATANIRETLHRQVGETISAGARLLTGCKMGEGTGFYYPPTVLADVPKGSLGYTDELFGPVACLFRVRDIDEAIELVNDTDFGLGSSVWTADDGERERFVHEIDAGSVFVNGMVASDARLPFGGIKHSGYGRELGVHGIREFVNVKTVWIKESASSGKVETE